MQLSTAQAAAALGIAEQTVRDACNAGRLRACRVGFRRLYRIAADDLRAFTAEYNYSVDEGYLASVVETVLE